MLSAFTALRAFFVPASTPSTTPLDDTLLVDEAAYKEWYAIEHRRPIRDSRPKPADTPENHIYYTRTYL